MEIFKQMFFPEEEVNSVSQLTLDWDQEGKEGR